jgi:MEDS: MEthanogen/methylotroph, DcmR Sensory domain
MPFSLTELRGRNFAVKMNALASFGGSPLAGGHLCAFFNDDDEEYRVLLPFIKDGFECGDKAVHIVNRAQRVDPWRRMTAAGIDLEMAKREGQFELRTNTETYLRDGRVDQDRMLKSFEQMASGGRDSRFPVSRIVCHMDWAAEGGSHIDDVVEFESRVNDVWRRHEDTVICAYPLSKFRGHEVVDIMRTHPMVIIGGLLLENPFFLPPEELLPELRARRANRGAAQSPST